MSNVKQLALETIFEHSLLQQERAILLYALENRERYKGFATFITPGLDNWPQVWDRFAFAILSANAKFEASIKALSYATSCKGDASPSILTSYGMYPRKADYINAIPRYKKIFKLLRGAGESWQEYRLRLTEVKGLGLCKASFAASLLYPLDCDLACIDTHIHQVFLHEPFKSLNLSTYQFIEDKVRALAHRVGVNTFLMQWLIWDHKRKQINDHAIFPGSHKV